MMMNVFE